MIFFYYVFVCCIQICLHNISREIEGIQLGTYCVMHCSSAVHLRFWSELLIQYFIIRKQTPSEGGQLIKILQ